jgi:hypothetical protein
MPKPLYLWERAPSIYWIEEWVDLRAGLDNMVKLFKQQIVKGLYTGCKMLRVPHCLDNRLTVNCEILRERERENFWGGRVVRDTTNIIGGQK